MLKVASNSAIVAGFSGPTSAIRRGLDAVRLGQDVLWQLAIDCKGADGLVVQDGRVYLLSDGLVWPRGSKLAACGSGGQEALAFIAGRGEFCPKEAHKYVAKVRDDCGRGVDFKPTP